MAQPKQTLYEILGVPRDANSIDIGLAYEKKSQELQRRSPPDPSAESLLHEAYEVLADPKRRAAYDANLVTASERAAAAERAAAPDLVLEGGDAGPPTGSRKAIAWTGMVVAGVAALVIVYFALRPERIPETGKESPAASSQAAPAPPSPPPPKPMTAAQMMAHATGSGGQVVSVEMSGRSTPLGIATAIAPNTMITTCHGIQAGRNLFVIVGKDSHGADLAINDEALDLCKLSVPGAAVKPLEVATADPRAGDKVFVVGLNAKGDFAITEGTIRKLVPTPHGPVLDLSVPIAPTGSGGAVFDEFGRLVGIATTSDAHGAGVNAALPAAWFAEARTRGAK